MALRPLIAICGTTGVGKSKLAIELASWLSRGSSRPNAGYHGARIINADSMQVYVGMDVITNKVPVEERGGIEHLLMDCKQPGEQLTGPEWIRDAMNVIDETHRRQQVPIVVGGTSYWIQHLIFPERMASLDQAPRAESPSLQDVPDPSEAFIRSLGRLSSQQSELFATLPEQAPNANENPDVAHELHALLTALDPPVAQRWHWRDCRKVLSSLRVIAEKRRLASEVIAQQSHVASKPRYRTLCFWLYADPQVLKPRLDSRVDDMIKQGLLDEIRTLRSIASAPPEQPDGTNTQRHDYTLGLYQAIGYKEFHDYLSAPVPSEDAFNTAVEQMKLSTRRYAKRQVAWIRNKLLPAVNAANAASGIPIVPTYLLDATELGDAWEKNVRELAEGLTEGFLNETPLREPSTLSDTAHKLLTVQDRPTDPLAILDANKRVVCTVCTVDPREPVMIDGAHWEIHLKSKGHRRMTGRDKPRGRPAHNIKEKSPAQDPLNDTVLPSECDPPQVITGTGASSTQV